MARIVAVAVLGSSVMTLATSIASPAPARAGLFSDCLNYAETLPVWDFESSGYAHPDTIDSSKPSFDRSWVGADGTWTVPRAGIMDNDRVHLFEGSEGADPISDAAIVRLYEAPTGAASFTLRQDGSFTYVPRHDTVQDSFSYWWYLTGYCSNVTTVTIRNPMGWLRDDTFRIDAISTSGVFQPLPPRVPYDSRAACGGLAVCSVFSNDERITPLSLDLTVTGNLAVGAEFAYELPDLMGLRHLDIGSNVTTVKGGSLLVRSDGTFVYTPAAGFTGQDSVYYRVGHASKDYQFDAGWVTWESAYAPGSVAPSLPSTHPFADSVRAWAKVTFDVQPRDQRALVVAVGDRLNVVEDEPLVISPATLLGNDQSASQVRSVQRIDPSPSTIPPSIRTAHGTLTINWNLTAANAGSYSINQLTYTPDPDYVGPDYFTYEARGILQEVGVPTTDNAVVSIDVTPVPDDPVANPDSGITDSATPITLDLAANDTDPDGDLMPSGLQIMKAGEGWTTDPSGAWTYTPPNYRYGLAGLDYRIPDSRGVYAISSALVRIMPLVGDAYQVDEDGQLTVDGPGVRANDAVPFGGEAVSVLVSTAPAHGELSLAASGAFTYTPDPDFAGTDTFRYRSTGGGSNYSDPNESALVTITVRPVADAPTVVLNADCADVAADAACAEPLDDRSITEGQSVRLRGYVTDADANFAGSLQVDWGDGSPAETLRYPCKASIFGVAFCLETVWLEPTWSGATASPNRMYFDLRHRYASDPAGTPDTYAITVQPSDAGATGSSAPATARVANLPPTIDIATNCGAFATGTFCLGRSSFLTVPADTSVTIAARVEDAGSDPVTVHVDWGDGTDDDYVMSCGTEPCADAAVHAVNACAVGPILFTPKSACGDISPSHRYAGNGRYRISVDVDDGDGGVLPTRVLNATVGPPNDTPVANDDTGATLPEDASTPLIVAAPGVLGNDTDGDGDTLEATLVSGPDHASTFDLDADGSWSYIPSPDFSGEDTFTYEACDPFDACDEATVSISVTGVNDPPTATGADLVTDEDTPIDIDLADYGSDPDGDALLGSVFGAPSHGSAEVTNGVTRYTPDPDYHGPDSMPYTVCDPTNECANGTIDLTVTAVNDRPTADDDDDTVVGGQTLTMPAPGVLDGDFDVDSATLTAVLVGGPSHAASFDLGANGSVSYTPGAGYVGTDSFTYRASDGDAQSALATVTITVTDPNVAPVARDDAYATDEDTELTIAAADGVLANDTDANGEELSASLVDGPDHGTLDLKASGRFTYAPDANFNGADSFTYEASDGTLDSATKTVRITVRSVNDAPTIVVTGGSCTSDADPSGTVTVRLADIETAAGSLTVTANRPNAQILPNRSVAVSGSGATRTITVNATATKQGGSGVVTLVVSDGGREGTTTVNVVVGTAKDETVAGTAGTDLVFGLSGVDTLAGAGAIDILCGGQGDDVLRGGNGADALYGLGGADTLEGGDGDDRLLGGGGNDTLRGQGGADAFTGGAGADAYADLSQADGDSQTEAP